MPTLLERNMILSEQTPKIAKDFILDYVNQKINNKSQLGNLIFVIKSGTGSGKSTVLPPTLYSDKKIAITQPTRATAESIPGQIIKYGGKKWVLGTNIGFQTGMINRTPKEGLVFMTPGILLQQLLFTEPEIIMRRYSAFIIDEVHKHDLTIDFLLRTLKLFYLKNWKNPDCPYLIVMSATIEPKIYMDYFTTTNFIEVKGAPSFPIVDNWPDTEISNINQYIDNLLQTIKGDTLVFLPTVKQINDLYLILSETHTNKDIIKIYGQADPATYANAFIQTAKPKVILSTNAIETGMTLETLDNVIDTGYVFSVTYDPTRNCNNMFIGPVNQSSSIQRRGRVGRIKPGTFYPMYTKEIFDTMSQKQKPDIYTNDISSFLLKMLVYEKLDVLALDMIFSPSSATLVNCFDKLYCLGLITTNWEPTLSGRIVSRLSRLSIEQARMIVAGYYHDADIYTLVVLACGLHMSKDIGNFSTFESILEKFKEVISIVDKFTSAKVEKWFVDQELNYKSWLFYFELIDDTLFSLIQEGLPVNFAFGPDNWDAIDLSIQDAYHLNIIVDDTIQYHGLQIYKKYSTVTIFDNLQYKKDKKGKMSLLPNITYEVRNPIDINFLY